MAGSDHVDHLLAQWARERPELDTSRLRIGARLVRLSRYLDRASGDHLAPWDLSEGEHNVLAALRRSGPPYQLTPTELYRSLLVSSGAMTNRLDRLEAAGLLVRTPDPDDRRRTRVGLTDRGREVIDAAIDAHVTALDEMFASLSPEDVDVLEGLLRTVLCDLEARDPDA
ncbi:MarR family winged helix-turn-helix transcriptional regulator [Nitriliruptor alkaliphilus]|uniref:MarR family winged helix-turn-helix transcriptional regulator n=1 Tax=Nitriliruptor alkaliphilus TaxID=427918 RepID=UPI000697D1AA|nr:MarR family transcriptional regulator [Nitriliruptor alkaliphilus]